MIKDSSESYRLYLTFLVHANLYDFNLMGTREFFVFTFGMFLFGYYYYFLISRCTVCAQDRSRAHALMFCGVILTLVCRFPGAQEKGLQMLKAENFFYEPVSISSAAAISFF